jgi:putative PIG3 family NAD(P)H quinone oxidoreductase
MPVTIRRADPSEAEALTVLAFAGKRYWGYPDSWLEAWRGLLTITPDYVTANVVVCAEDEAGRVVGFYALERDDAGVRLENLFLAPAVIGSGLGRQLFEHAAQTARDLGASELLIESDPNALEFYRHMGAQRIGETVSRLTGEERLVPLLRYALATEVPDTMAAVEVTTPGGPEVLKSTRRPVPKPKPGEVLIEVHAAGVNRPDVLQRTGNYNPPPGTTDIPGLEVAGRIAAVGPKVHDWKVADRVCALLAGGGYAEFCVAPAGQCLPVPVGFSMVEAAVLPETFFTVWSNVFERGRLQPGETLLVHGGSSGIGTTAIQLSRAFGARVFATAGTAEKCAACERLGAERAINYRTEDFAAVVKELTGGKGVDVVLDMVGGDYIASNIDCLAMDGRHVSIASLKGPRVTLDLYAVMRKRLTLTGSTLRPRSVADKAAIAAQLRKKVWPKLADGSIRPVVHRTFPLAEADKAHALMESSEHVGKIALVVREDTVGFTPSF